METAFERVLESDKFPNSRLQKSKIRLNFFFNDPTSLELRVRKIKR